MSGDERRFEPGDLVQIKGPSGQELARGMTNFSSQEVERIMGRHSREIGHLLGRRDFEEVVHRDNMWITDPDSST